MRAKSAIVRKQASVEQDLEHQSQKAKIIEEDRRVFFLQAEEIKQRNDEEATRLRTENAQLKAVRDDAADMRRPQSILAQTTYSNSRLQLTPHDEHSLRMVLDREKHKTKTLKDRLLALQSKMHAAGEGRGRDDGSGKAIRVLENELDKVMIHFNEAVERQRTHEQVLKRLKEERVGYDSQLAAIEDCLKDKEKEFEEMLLLAHDATHAKETAHAELKRHEQRRVTIQELRAKSALDRANGLASASLANSPSEALTENPLKKAGEGKAAAYKHEENYQKHELSDYEDAFRRLKEVTGVIDANEIIQKFKTQGLTTSSLEELQRNYQERIGELARDKERLRRQAEEHKFLKGEAGGSRRTVDVIEEESAQATNRLERTTLRLRKLDKVLIDAKAGVQHLLELCDWHRSDQELPLEDALKGVNEKLRRMYDIVKNHDFYKTQAAKQPPVAATHLYEESSDEEAG